MKKTKSNLPIVYLQNEGSPVTHAFDEHGKQIFLKRVSNKMTALKEPVRPKKKRLRSNHAAA